MTENASDSSNLQNKSDREAKETEETEPDKSATEYLLAIFAGCAAGILGLLPWLLSGQRLPLQNLWQLDTPANAMPIAWLPLNQYMVTDLLGLLLVGALAAGIIARCWPARRRRSASWFVGLGLLAVQIAASLQSFYTLGSGLELSAQSGRLVNGYFYGLLVGVIATVLIGLAVFALLRAQNPASNALALGLAAVPLASWLVLWFAYFSPIAQTPQWLPYLQRWSPAVVIGLALIWCGTRPAIRLIVWAANLLLLWLLPALFTALSAALGSRVLAGDPVEMANYFIEVLRAALGSLDTALLPVALALAIAVVGSVIRNLLGQRHRPSKPRHSAIG
ncbi:hypothetical protein [Psychromicrobium lacuslunae]|uniref:hypothetical protein n=1 Tax=Psychromicrobium lacuslunae TaxID=1618207 RepID=UPI000695FFAE|nr:hypothetical protein [Psychromicrobium lacuslunae]